MCKVLRKSVQLVSVLLEVRAAVSNFTLFVLLRLVTPGRTFRGRAFSRYCVLGICISVTFEVYCFLRSSVNGIPRFHARVELLWLEIIANENSFISV